MTGGRFKKGHPPSLFGYGRTRGIEGSRFKGSRSHLPSPFGFGRTIGFQGSRKTIFKEIKDV
jgi:hypothetical protein